MKRYGKKIYAEIEKFFPDLEVVGWFAAMPGITQERFLYLKSCTWIIFPVA